ncbi:GNAT family N-acetyltransferase [Streptomyces sp. NPDC093060]|uniref:GNAT family N-acetyltransferase n=1 Tax=Streptomyces sp. NPDC093060 TaxID=3366019 RepID=UPI0037FB28F4
MLIDIWPLKALRVRSPRLELRLPSEEELAAVAEVAARGVHAPGTRPFLTPWTDRSPLGRSRHVVQQHWSRLGAWSPDNWALELVVFFEGHPVGIQEMRAEDFGIRREIVSGSWLGIDHQSQGLGTEMRGALLHLAFAELGAVSARSVSFTDNHASMAVSRKLGYQPDGISRDVLDGQVVESQYFRLSQQGWSRSEHLPMTVSGLADCADLFGIDHHATDSDPANAS